MRTSIARIALAMGMCGLDWFPAEEEASRTPTMLIINDGAFGYRTTFEESSTREAWDRLSTQAFASNESEAKLAVNEDLALWVERQAELGIWFQRLGELQLIHARRPSCAGFKRARRDRRSAPRWRRGRWKAKS